VLSVDSKRLKVAVFSTNCGRLVSAHSKWLSAEADSPKLIADRIEKNPRTGLRPMRGTKVDDTGPEMR